MTKKYAVYPGYVTSVNDGDRHWISAQQLMELYEINPAECVIVDRRFPEKSFGVNLSELRVIRPRRFHWEYPMFAHLRPKA